MSKSAARDYERLTEPQPLLQRVAADSVAALPSAEATATRMWSAEAHVDVFSPSQNIELHDMRAAKAGWSLRIKRPSTPNETLVQIPWDHILDTDKACAFVRALRNALLLDETRPADPALEAFLAREARAAPEFMIACALLAAKQMHLNPSPVLDGLPSTHLDGDVLRTFVHRFHWCHAVIQECGDLGIPLTWEATLGAHARLLHCDATLHARVAQDAEGLVSRRVALEGLWAASGLPRTLLPDDASHLFGNNVELTRYVAWVRSRWICFLSSTAGGADDATPNTSAVKSGPAQQPSDKQRRDPQKKHQRSAPEQRYAVCPLIEKLNHHPNSAICPTVAAGEYVSIVSEANATSPNQLSVCGDELFISYGALPNVCLLERYGFLMTPLPANEAEVIEIALPAVDGATLERWRIADDAIATRWMFRPNAAMSASSSAPPIPVKVLFAVAVASLGMLEASGRIVAPAVAAAASSMDSDNSGVKQQKSAQHEEEDNSFGCCFGEVSDSDDDVESVSWFYDEDRMQRFLDKHQDAVMDAVLDALDRIVSDNILQPARHVMFTMANWSAEASTKELREQLLASSNSRFWATRYAEQRATVGETLVGHIARMRSELSGARTSDHRKSTTAPNPTGPLTLEAPSAAVAVMAV